MKKNPFTIIMLVFNVSFVMAQQPQSFSIDIPGVGYVAQKQSNWCWAACNQILLNAKDISESQDNQVTKLFGSRINSGAGPNFEKAKLALGGIYTTNSGNQVRGVPYVSYLSQRNSTDPFVIINHLKASIPVVMATQGHGRVCTGIDYVQNGTHIQITTMIC